MRGDPAPARAGRRNSGACRKDSGIDIRARWPADKSCAQCFKHRAQRRWIYASPDPQPLAGRQHQFQNNICGSLRPNGSCFHQCESHRLPLSQPLPPIVEGLFRNLLLPTKLLHGHPAALLRSNPFAPTFFSVSDFLFHAGSLPSWPTMRDPNRIKNSGSQGAYGSPAVCCTFYLTTIYQVHVTGRVNDVGDVLWESKLLPRPATGSCEGSRPSYLVPNPEPFTTELSVISGGEQVASEAKVRGDDAVHLNKTLSVPSGLEPSHAPLPLPRRLMRVLGAVV